MMKNSIYSIRTTCYPHNTNWLYFYIFIRFPLGFIFNGIYIINSIIEGEGLFALLINIALLAFQISVYVSMRELSKKGFTKNMALLVVETLFYGLSNGVGALVGFALIWNLPNYIYFEKRADLFYDGIQSAKHTKTFKESPEIPDMESQLESKLINSVPDGDAEQV